VSEQNEMRENWGEKNKIGYSGLSVAIHFVSHIPSLREADALLLHLNSFNSESHYWDLPKEVDRSLGLFELRRIATINGQQQRLALAERYEWAGTGDDTL